MKTFERTDEQNMAATLQTSLFAIALDYGISFTNSQYRDGKRFVCELKAFVNDDKQVVAIEVDAHITEEGERYIVQQFIFDYERSASEHCFKKEVFDKYEVLEIVCNWVRTI